MKTMLAIASVEALIAPFAAAPRLEILLADDLGTARRHFQIREDADLETLEGEARALETVGEIDAEELATDWTLDADALAAEDAMRDADADDVDFDYHGQPVVEDELASEFENVD